MNKTLVIFFLLDFLAITCFGANVNRFKRGFLSRTGVCPDPSRNFQKRDRRLNYFGNAILVKKGNKDVTCVESECIEDSHCDADRKCCKNRCGGMVCTKTVRDQDPCSNFACPAKQSCKIQRVKCVMPECNDAYALNRPTCIPDTEATVLLHDDNRVATPGTAQGQGNSAPLESATYGGSYGNNQQWYNNNQQMTQTNNYGSNSTPQPSYYTANQQMGNDYGNGQQNNWLPNNYQTQQ